MSNPSGRHEFLRFAVKPICLDDLGSDDELNEPASTSKKTTSQPGRGKGSPEFKLRASGGDKPRTKPFGIADLFGIGAGSASAASSSSSSWRANGMPPPPFPDPKPPQLEPIPSRSAISPHTVNPMSQSPLQEMPAGAEAASRRLAGSKLATAGISPIKPAKAPMKSSFEKFDSDKQVIESQLAGLGVADGAKAQKKGGAIAERAGKAADQAPKPVPVRGGKGYFGKAIQSRSSRQNPSNSDTSSSGSEQEDSGSDQDLFEEASAGLGKAPWGAGKKGGAASRHASAKAVNSDSESVLPLVSGQVKVRWAKPKRLPAGSTAVQYPYLEYHAVKEDGSSQPIDPQAVWDSLKVQLLRVEKDLEEHAKGGKQGAGAKDRRQFEQFQREAEALARASEQSLKGTKDLLDDAVENAMERSVAIMGVLTQVAEAAHITKSSITEDFASRFDTVCTAFVKRSQEIEKALNEMREAEEQVTGALAQLDSTGLLEQGGEGGGAQADSLTPNKGGAAGGAAQEQGGAQAVRQLVDILEAVGLMEGRGDTRAALDQIGLPEAEIERRVEAALAADDFVSTGALD